MIFFSVVVPERPLFFGIPKVESLSLLDVRGQDRAGLKPDSWAP